MKKQKRILSLLLAAVMVMALLPAGAWAAAPAEVIPCQYDQVEDFHEGYAAVKLNGKWGFIDTAGKEAVPCEYDTVMDFCDGFAKVELDDKLGLVDGTGRKITPCQYYEMGSWARGIATEFDENGLMRVQKFADGTYGFINTDGKEVIPCKYTDAGLFQEGLALVAIRTDDYERKYGFIDTTGAEVIPCRYGYTGSFYEGIARVSTVNMYSFCGYIDRTGREVVPCKYEYSYASNFHDGYGLIQEKTENGCRWLTIDHTGAVVSSHTSEHCYTVERDFDSEQNVAIVSEGGKYGAIDRNGREVIPCIYDRIDAYFLNGCRLVYNKKSAGAISGDEYVGGFDAAGKEIFPCIYDSAIVNNGYVGLIKDGYRDSRSNIYMGNACLIEMKTGNVVVPFGKYDFIGADVGPDLVKVHIGESVYTGNWGLVNKKTGKEVVPCKYDAMHAPYEGYLAVSQNYRWGFLDTTGKEVVSCRYDSVKDFSEGYAAVQQDGKWGFVDTTGKEVVSCRYDSVEDFSEGYAAVWLNGKWGFISASGAAAPTTPVASDFVIENGVLTEYKGKGGDVVIPDGVTRIEAGAFFRCTGLKSVTIPNSVTYMECSAFNGCSGLKSVTIPVSVTGIGSGAFEGCENLTDVYYGGTQAQWKAIGVFYYGLEAFSSKWGTFADPERFADTGLSSATIHCTDATIKAPAKTAVENTQAVKVDGKDVTFYTYALVDEKGGITNYVKLRDVAAVLSGTKGQFEVGWNGSINLETGKPYTAVGGELEKTFVGDQPYVPGDSPVNVNGRSADLEAITLVDAKGGNYNYFKLRDLGKALGFNVGWSAEKGIFIESDKPYTDAD